MATYFIAASTIVDPEGVARYESAAGATLADRDIKVRAFTRDAQTIEGTSPGERLVMLEFPSPEAFREWYDSPEYQAVLPDRLSSTKGFAVLVEGMD